MCRRTEDIGVAGPTRVTIELTWDERAELRRWTRRRKTAEAFAAWVRIVHAAADELNIAQICAMLGVVVQPCRRGANASARTHDGRPLNILTLVDDHSREWLAIDVARRMTSDDVLERLA